MSWYAMRRCSGWIRKAAHPSPAGDTRASERRHTGQWGVTLLGVPLQGVSLQWNEAFSVRAVAPAFLAHEGGERWVRGLAGARRGDREIRA